MEIPPWIQPANEAQYAAQGMQIGARIGEAQAQQQLELERQAFMEQQALKAQQLKANEDARQQTLIGLQAAAAARKSQAMLEYQKAAMDPNADMSKLLMQYGPAMGEHVPAGAFRPKPQPVTWTPIDLPGGAKGMQSSQGHLMQVHQPAAPAKWETQQRQDDEGNTYDVQVNTVTGEEKASPKVPRTGQITQIDRDELRQLERDREDLKKPAPGELIAQQALTEDPKTWNTFKKAAVKAYQDKQSKIADLENQIGDIRKKISGKAGSAVDKAPSKSKVARAKEISAQHPDWPKQQVIDAVNQEFANAARISNP